MRVTPPVELLLCRAAPRAPVCLATVPQSCTEQDLRDYALGLMVSYLDCRARLADVRAWSEGPAGE